MKNALPNNNLKDFYFIQIQKEYTDCLNSFPSSENINSINTKMKIQKYFEAKETKKAQKEEKSTTSVPEDKKEEKKKEEEVDIFEINQSDDDDLDVMSILSPSKNEHINGIKDLERAANKLSEEIHDSLVANKSKEEIDELIARRRHIWEEIEVLEKGLKYQQVEKVDGEDKVGNSADANDDVEVYESFQAENINPDNELMTYISYINKEVFGHDKFRGVQAVAIEHALKGKDVFVLMPTGGGKSLVYQLSGYIQKGLTVVISPLISLMIDQVRSLNVLNNKDLRAELLLSKISKTEYTDILDRTKKGEVRFLFITPEKLLSSVHLLNFLLEMHSERKITRFVIDEAHCISQWGHDFRPTYAQLNIIKERFKDVPIMALTATATTAVKYDIINKLSIQNCSTFQMSYNRPNLFYEVIEKAQSQKDSYQQIFDYIHERHLENKCGIIFCLSTTDTEQLSQWLNDHGLNTDYYHAQIKDNQQRLNAQKKWMESKVNILVATVAFGMGIDKPDVRFIIHHTMPKSIEEYYQESGRAGRDGKLSYCMLLFKIADKQKVSRLITYNDGNPKAEERVQVEMKLLEAMVNYCMEKFTCRRSLLLKYFSEEFDSSNCKENCDNCIRGKTGLSKFTENDYTLPAVDIANIINHITKYRKDTSPYPTSNYVLSIYFGRKSKCASDMEIDEFGKGNGFKDDPTIYKIFPLLIENLIIKYCFLSTPHGTIQYFQTDVNYDSFVHKEKPKIIINKEEKIVPEGMNSLDMELYKKLIEVRQNLASDRNISVTNIISTDILKKLTIAKPQTNRDLLEIQGFTKRKIDNYGKYFLEAIARCTESHNENKQINSMPNQQRIGGYPTIYRTQGGGTNQNNFSNSIPINSLPFQMINQNRNNNMLSQNSTSRNYQQLQIMNQNRNTNMLLQNQMMNQNRNNNMLLQNQMMNQNRNNNILSQMQMMNQNRNNNMLLLQNQMLNKNRNNSNLSQMQIMNQNRNNNILSQNRMMNQNRNNSNLSQNYSSNHTLHMQNNDSKDVTFLDSDDSDDVQVQEVKKPPMSQYLQQNQINFFHKLRDFVKK